MTVQNDIPVAQRVTSPPAKHPSMMKQVGQSFQAVPWWGYSLAVLAFFAPLAGSRFFLAVSEASSDKSSNQTIVTPTPLAPAATNPTQNSSNQDPSSFIASPEPTQENILGHFAYAEAPLNALHSVGRAADGYEIKLREPAAKSYLQMVEAARANGISLIPISGFRTKSEQRQLFFDISKQRNQTPAQRAMVSAPPGYSEHHTGYVIDIGDGANPSTNLSPAFEQTSAFKWLEANAAQYGFELSFPPNNPQGVMYEPWHWRYVGDDDSLATFYKNQPRSTAAGATNLTAPQVINPANRSSVSTPASETQN